MQSVRFAVVCWMMITLAGLAMMATFANAQEAQDENRTRERARTEQTASAASAADKQIAYCLSVDNWKEVQVSQAALPLLQNEEVKQFAEQMVAAHSQAMKKPQGIAGETASNADASRNRLRRASNDPNATPDTPNESETPRTDEPAIERFN